MGQVRSGTERSGGARSGRVRLDEVGPPIVGSIPAMGTHSWCSRAWCSKVGQGRERSGQVTLQRFVASRRASSRLGEVGRGRARSASAWCGPVWFPIVGSIPAMGTHLGRGSVWSGVVGLGDGRERRCMVMRGKPGTPHSGSQPSWGTCPRRGTDWPGWDGLGEGWVGSGEERSGRFAPRWLVTTSGHLHGGAESGSARHGMDGWGRARSGMETRRGPDRSDPIGASF